MRQIANLTGSVVASGLLLSAGLVAFALNGLLDVTFRRRSGDSNLPAGPASRPQVLRPAARIEPALSGAQL